MVISRTGADARGQMSGHWGYSCSSIQMRRLSSSDAVSG